jgi:hypothetical protein
VSGLKTDVASVLVACEQSDTQPSCSNLIPCVRSTLKRACPDPTTTAPPCASVVSACADGGANSDGGGAPISEADCEAFLAGFNASTTYEIATCLTQACAIDACERSFFTY